jgi:hypothetical protein
LYEIIISLIHAIIVKADPGLTNTLNNILLTLPNMNTEILQSFQTNLRRESEEKKQRNIVKMLLQNYIGVGKASTPVKQVANLPETVPTAPKLPKLTWEDLNINLGQIFE